MNKNILRLMQYVEHEDNCKLIRCSASQGRPTKNDGYEVMILGKWYQTSPIDKSPKFKCTCGLDDIIKLIK